MMVLLPAPEAPTKAIIFPASAFRVKSFSEGSSALGYLYQTFLNSTLPLTRSILLEPGSFSRGISIISKRLSAAAPILAIVPFKPASLRMAGIMRSIAEM